MTYRELFYKATRLINHNQITLGEYKKMTKPLDGEIEQEDILDKIRDEIRFKQEIQLKGEETSEWNKCIEEVLEIIDKYKAESDEKMINTIDFAIKATDTQDDYSMGMRNGMRYVKSLIDGKEPQYELRRTDEEIKLGIDLGDEVVGDYGARGVVVGIDTHKEAGVMLSLLMGNHKVPQLVQASNYKTKTGRHFPQIVEVLEQIKGEADGK